MLNIISNLLAKSQPEIKGCFRALEEVSREYSNSLSYDKLIKPRLNLILNKYPSQILNHLRKTNTSPSDYLFDQIASYSLDLVASGNYHIYRGVLSMLGKDLHSVFLHTIKRLKESGDLTEDDVQKSINNINDEIKSWG